MIKFILLHIVFSHRRWATLGKGLFLLSILSKARWILARSKGKQPQNALSFYSIFKHIYCHLDFYGWANIRNMAFVSVSFILFTFLHRLIFLSKPSIRARNGCELIPTSKGSERYYRRRIDLVIELWWFNMKIVVIADIVNYFIRLLRKPLDNLHSQ